VIHQRDFLYTFGQFHVYFILLETFVLYFILLKISSYQFIVPINVAFIHKKVRKHLKENNNINKEQHWRGTKK